ncbi:C40 family peptidase [Actinoplanes bogorensis]|uniref:C40 family peptidase n=1 Tax=Paractinoplanes bogorensis TaxID=1610840 RepID=A0ABS5YXY7_9ACTN|nr:NlpC/P60 family protein [Actinoplanes bogorensis]MBU2668315.1 C40 family peptidase [Actinoplanes bogorensis]
MTLRRAVLLLAAAVIATSLFVAPSAASAAPRAAATAGPVSAAQAAAAALAARGTKIVAAARNQRGKPYRYGARGPSAFDCSGLAGYAYAKAGVRLPRTAQAQYRRARKITAAAARPGDLVFWVSGNHAYHVAVYAGAGQVWHAPKPGDRVKLAKIWNWKQVRFGRV